MGKIHSPRRGSIAYSPRKRAKREVPRIRSWPEENGKPGIQSFAGYKAGMTHVAIVDDTPNSTTEGMEISVPVTILETPSMRVAAIRAYTRTSYGDKPIAESWAKDLDKDLGRIITLPKNHDTEAAIKKIDELIAQNRVSDIYAITYTVPDRISGIPRKKPDVMESRIAGEDLKARFEYAKQVLGKEVNITDVFSIGDQVDVFAVTKGKGTQGPVKRWGIAIQKRKHSRTGKERHVGNLGPWNPHHISWRVPQLGQTGYHQRTDYNKRILRIGSAGVDITPAGGFLNYGIIRNGYVMLKGTIPGTVKRLVRLRHAIRPSARIPKNVPEITFISLESKQGA